MKNTRDSILKQLASSGQATVNQLAEQVGVNPITVRHHLTNLSNENLVQSTEQRHGVGRPRLLYRLTEEGQQRFPANYKRLTESLLLSIKNLYGKQASIELLELVGKEMADYYKSVLKGSSLEEYINKFSQLMAGEGFQIQWELKGSRIYIHNASCPYHHLNSSHPEICHLDHSLFSCLLDPELRFEGCIMEGKPECTYSYEVKND